MEKFSSRPRAQNHLTVGEMLELRKKNEEENLCLEAEKQRRKQKRAAENRRPERNGSVRNPESEKSRRDTENMTKLAASSDSSNGVRQKLKKQILMKTRGAKTARNRLLTGNAEGEAFRGLTIGERN